MVDTKTSGRPDKAPPDDARQLANACEIVNVRVARLVAELTNETLSPSPVDKLKYERTSSYAIAEKAFGAKFDFEFEFLGSRETSIAHVEFSIIVDHILSDDSFVPSTDAVDFMTSTTSYFAAYPYARELLQSTTSRLGLAPQIMGLIRRDSLDKEFGVIEVYPPSLGD